MGSPPLLLLGKDPLAPWVTAPADEGGITAAATARLAPPSRTLRRDASGLACGFCLVIASLLNSCSTLNGFVRNCSAPAFIARISAPTVNGSKTTKGCVVVPAAREDGSDPDPPQPHIPQVCSCFFLGVTT